MTLFPDEGRHALSAGAWCLRGFAFDEAETLLKTVQEITAHAPFRHLVTPSGHRMSVAMSNCGELGWVSDRRGYRYTADDPDSGRPWPAMPEIFRKLAARAASAAGFERFTPDACLINRYAPGARLSLHQDQDEGDLSQPIVSVSLGVPARFLWGGARRQDRPLRITLEHGDVVVWGGPARLTFHGVAELAHAHHALTDSYRYNLTFRKAG